MLLMTKTEIHEKLSCFQKIIDIYQHKIEKLEKLLNYIENEDKNIDIFTVNWNSEGEIFGFKDEIKLLKGEDQKPPDPPTLCSNTLQTPCFVNNNSQICAQFVPVIQNHSIHTHSNTSISTQNTPTTCYMFLPSAQSVSSTTLQQHTNPNPPLSTQNNSVNPLTMFMTMLPTSTNINSTSNISTFQSTDNIPSSIKSTSNSNQTCHTSEISKHPIKEESHINEVKIKRSSTMKNVFLTDMGLESLSEDDNYNDQEEPEPNEKTNDKQINHKNNYLLVMKPPKLNEASPGKLPQIQKPTTKERKYKCELCHNSFGQKGVLNRHKFLRHSPFVIKPHICPICGKGFTLKHHLKNHLKCKTGCNNSAAGAAITNSN